MNNTISKRKIFKKVLKHAIKRIKPNWKLISILFLAIFLISFLRMSITHEGILLYYEIDTVFSVLIAVAVIFGLFLFQFISYIHFLYHSNVLGKIKRDLIKEKRERGVMQRSEDDK